MRSMTGLFSVFVACFIAAGNAALSQEWVVDKANGLAEVLTEGQSWAPLSEGVSIPNDSWVRTGPRGLVLLRRNEETILLKPETMASVLSREEESRQTIIGQRSGSLLLDIEKRMGKHTTVRTPFLAAIVKGTRFEVDVSAISARVTVLDGVVETVDTRSGDRADVHSGQNVEVRAMADQPMVVRGAALERSDAQAAPLTPLRFGLSDSSGEPTGLSVKAGRGPFARDSHDVSGPGARGSEEDAEPGGALTISALIVVAVGSMLLLWLLRTIGLVMNFGDREARSGGTRVGSGRRR